MTSSTTGTSGRTLASAPARRRRRSTSWAPYAFMAPAVIAVSVMVIYPILHVLVQSFFDVRPTKHQGWRFTGVDNYVEAFQDAEVWAVFGRSLVWTVGSVGFQFLVALGAALVLMNLVGGRWMRAVLVLPWATPIVVGSLAWKLLYQEHGLVNQMLEWLGLGGLAHAWLADPDTALGAVMVANVWRGFPFIMVMLIAGMVSVPPELYEAAEMDGSNWWQRFRSITLPSIKPSVMASTLMALIWTFNSFSNIYVLTGGGPAGATDILTTFVYKEAFQRFDFGYSSALSMVLFAVVGIGSALYIRAFGKESLT